MSKVILHILLFISISLFSQTNKNDILGTWLNEKEEAKIEFTETNGRYDGKIIWLKEPLTEDGKPLADIHNPDAALRTRTIMGMPVVESLTFESGEWKGGRAYSPRKGKYFRCKAWLEGKRTMKIRGYWGFLFVTETWKKTKG